MNTPALVGNPGRRDRLYGIRTVDEDGGFSGDTMEGSPLPNRIGSVRTTGRLRSTVNGDWTARCSPDRAV
jgi:hypothetical protein